MQELARRGCNRILWECGSQLATAAVQQGCVQELMVMVAPKLLGGSPAKTPLADLGFSCMDQVVMLKPDGSQRVGCDWLLQLLIA
jgi:diaminohydroxyphosphoribosylaminopyrimidine deaminase/5-amino-6-(5-phosphoribosylamino)uracil reductase